MGATGFAAIAVGTLDFLVSVGISIGIDKFEDEIKIIIMGGDSYER
ncbi:MAG: hypothetical protein RR636_06675 [Clostridium sp.]